MSELKEFDLNATKTLQEVMDMVWEKRKQIVDTYAKRFMKCLIDIQKGYNITAYNGNSQKVNFEIGSYDVNFYKISSPNRVPIVDQMNEDFPEFNVSIINEYMKPEQLNFKLAITKYCDLNFKNDEKREFVFFLFALFKTMRSHTVEVDKISEKKRLFKDSIYRIKLKFTPLYEELFKSLQKYNNDNEIHFVFYKVVEKLVGTQDKYNIFEEVETTYYHKYDGWNFNSPIKVFICYE